MNNRRIGKFFGAGLALAPAAFAIGIFLLPGRAAALDATELISYFVDQLTPYGSWEDRQPYGRVWEPSQQTKDWRPYSQGHWVYSQEHGWVWRADEAWGEIPYHYGRWANSQNRWFWVPDDTWGPAWVDWREDDDHIGWGPLPPEAEWNRHDEWRPSYNMPNYSRNSYVFIPRRHFASQNIHSYIVPYSETAPIYQRSRNVTVYRTVNQRIVNEGPRRELIERATGQKLKPVHFEPRTIKARTHAREQDKAPQHMRVEKDRPEPQEAKPHEEAKKVDRGRQEPQSVKSHQREARAPQEQKSRPDQAPQHMRGEKERPKAQEAKPHEEAKKVDRGRQEVQSVKSHQREARAPQKQEPRADKHLRAEKDRPEPQEAKPHGEAKKAGRGGIGKGPKESSKADKAHSKPDDAHKDKKDGKTDESKQGGNSGRHQGKRK